MCPARVGPLEKSEEPSRGTSLPLHSVPGHELQEGLMGLASQPQGTDPPLDAGSLGVQ